jgi:flagellar basal body-associated protein FliL
MSDKEAKKEAAPAPEAEAKPKKKGGKKVLIMVAVAMIGEAAVLMGVLKMGGPQATQAAEQPHSLEADGSQIAKELLVVEDKFQNLQTGRVWVWDASIYVQVKTKYAPAVEEILKRRGATVREGLSQIFSRAQHAQLVEPDRQTLNRQIVAFLEKLMEEEKATLENGPPPGSGKADEKGGHGKAEEHAAAAPAAGAHGDGSHEAVDPKTVIQKVLIPKCRGFPTDF